MISRTGTLNDKNGGSQALLLCLRGLGMWYHLDCGARARRAWETTAKLAEMGARFMPNAEDMRHIRSQLRHASTAECVELTSTFLKTGAADCATLGMLFGTPAMRRRFVGYGRDQMADLLGPHWWRPSCRRQTRHARRSGTAEELA